MLRWYDDHQFILVEEMPLKALQMLYCLNYCQPLSNLIRTSGYSRLNSVR
jgi:hypothetical protein